MIQIWLVAFKKQAFFHEDSDLLASSRLRYQNDQDQLNSYTEKDDPEYLALSPF